MIRPDGRGGSENGDGSGRVFVSGAETSENQGRFDVRARTEAVGAEETECQPAEGRDRGRDVATTDASTEHGPREETGEGQRVDAQGRLQQRALIYSYADEITRRETGRRAIGREMQMHGRPLEIAVEQTVTAAAPSGAAAARGLAPCLDPDAVVVERDDAGLLFDHAHGIGRTAAATRSAVAMGTSPTTVTRNRAPSSFSSSRMTAEVAP